MKKYFWIVTIIFVLFGILALLNAPTIVHYYHMKGAEGTYKISAYDESEQLAIAGELNVSIRRWNTKLGLHYPLITLRPIFEEHGGTFTYDKAVFEPALQKEYGIRYSVADITKSVFRLDNFAHNELMLFSEIKMDKYTQTIFLVELLFKDNKLGVGRHFSSLLKGKITIEKVK